MTELQSLPGPRRTLCCDLHQDTISRPLRFWGSAWHHLRKRMWLCSYLHTSLWRWSCWCLWPNTCVLSASKDGTYARSELHLQTQGTSNFNPSTFPWKNIRGKISSRRNTHFRKTEFFKIKIFLKELYPQFQMRLKHKKKSGILETKREPKFLFLTFLYIIDNNWFLRP